MNGIGKVLRAEDAFCPLPFALSNRYDNHKNRNSSVFKAPSR